MAQTEEIEKAKEEMAKKADPKSMDQTGACVYNAGSGTYCAVLTNAQCSQLGGTWFSGRSCP